MSRTVNYLLLFIGVTGAAGFVLNAKYAKPQLELARNPSSVAADISVSDGAISFRPQDKTIYRYRFSRKISFLGLSNKIPETNFQGELSMDVYRVSEVGFDALVRGKVADQKQASPAVLRVHVSSNGKNLNIFTRKLRNDDEREQVNILKDLMANWVFPLRTDTVGEFTAEFSSMPEEKGFLRKRKKKIAYFTPKTAPEIISSVHDLSWNNSIELPQFLNGEESFRLGKGNTAIVANSAYEIEFKNSSQSSGVSAAELAMLDTADSLNLTLEASKLNHPDFDGITWERVVRELANIHNLSKMDQLKVFGDLIHVLRAHGEILPELLGMLGPDVIAQGAASPLFANIVGALATVATPSMQAALVSMYQDPNASFNTKGSILTALTTTQASIDDATREFLSTAMRGESNTDLARGAGYALGSSMQNAPADSSSVDQGIAAIQNEWSALQGQNKNLPQELALLDAMGNSGRVDFFGDLSSVINGNDDALARAKAVFALRFINTNSAISLLDSSLSNIDPKIRNAALQAMQVAPWNESFRVPLQNCIASEQLASLQSACASVLEQGNSSRMAAR